MPTLVRDLVLADLAVERAAIDVKDFSSEGDVAIRVLESGFDNELLRALERCAYGNRDIGHHYCAGEIPCITRRVKAWSA